MKKGIFMLIFGLVYLLSNQIIHASSGSVEIKKMQNESGLYSNTPQYDGAGVDTGVRGAADGVSANSSNVISASPDSPTTVGGNANKGSSTTVIVTEKIPGMDCPEEGTGSGPSGKKYKCTIQPGFGSIMLILKGLIKYATFITALIGVLMLVVSGIQYSIAGADKDAAGAAKKRIEKVLAGIILLFLVGFILNSVAPWIYY